MPTGGHSGNLLSPDYEDDEDNPMGIPLGIFDYDSADDLMYEHYDDVYTAECKLCAKLGVAYTEKSYVRLELHMKMK